jgi:hypothetical protein
MWWDVKVNQWYLKVTYQESEVHLAAAEVGVGWNLGTSTVMVNLQIHILDSVPQTVWDHGWSPVGKLYRGPTKYSPFFRGSAEGTCSDIIGLLKNCSKDPNVVMAYSPHQWNAKRIRSCHEGHVSPGPYQVALGIHPEGDSLCVHGWSEGQDMKHAPLWLTGDVWMKKPLIGPWS